MTFDKLIQLYEQGALTKDTLNIHILENITENNDQQIETLPLLVAAEVFWKCNVSPIADDEWTKWRSYPDGDITKYQNGVEVFRSYFKNKKCKDAQWQNFSLLLR